MKKRSRVMVFVVVMVVQLFSVSLAFASEKDVKLSDTLYMTASEIESYGFKVFYGEDIYGEVRQGESGDVINIDVEKYPFLEGYMGDIEEIISRYAMLQDQPYTPWLMSNPI